MNFTLKQASHFAAPVDHLSFILACVVGFIILLVFSLMIFFCVRYRQGSPADRGSPPTRSGPLEFAIAACIFAFGLGVFVASAKLYYRMYAPPASSDTVYVVAKQWMWNFEDGQGRKTINELTLPVNRPVRLVMTSEDVIHSFYVPAFRVKQDILPDRYTSLWFIPTELGDFSVLCTQYCGLSHSAMRAMIHVVPGEKPSQVPKNVTEKREVAHAG